MMLVRVTCSPARGSRTFSTTNGSCVMESGSNERTTWNDKEKQMENLIA